MNENQLIIALSRLSDDVDVEKIQEMLSENMDWYYFHQISAKNKVFELCISNLEKVGLAGRIPKEISEIFRQRTTQNLNQYQLNKKELMTFINTCYEKKLKLAPVKGIYLSDFLYQDPSIRKSNDVDVLILMDDIPQMTEILQQQGFINKPYNREKKKFFDYDRLTVMKYKLTMYNLLPFIKVQDDQLISFDLSFALDFDRKTSDVVNQMLQNVKVEPHQLPTMKNTDYLIHLLVHSYREASNASWIELNKDITLRKFCDIREFIRVRLTDGELQTVVSQMLAINQKSALIFNMYSIHEIYQDHFSQEILQQLAINQGNMSDYFKFFEDDRKTSHARQKSLWDSLFSLNNLDELR